MNDKLPKVCVMIATYNGERYIEPQVDSILEQDGVEVCIIVRDDGSTDHTLELLSKYEKKGLLKITRGNNLGPADNFLTMTKEAPLCDYYAWSDQDDIWDSDKLKIGILTIGESSKPMLYYSASRTIDKHGNVMGVIGADRPSLAFEQALIQSKAQGATFVFNHALREMAIKYTPPFKRLGILHDAWLHRVCLAIGGTVIHDPKPHMSYRIHDNNVVAKMPTKSLFERIKNAASINALYYCSNVANELIVGYGKYMSSKNYKLAERLASYRTNIKYKMWIIFSNRIKVGSIKDNLKFKLNILINRM